MLPLLAMFIPQTEEPINMITPEIIEEVKKRLIAVYKPEAIYLFGSYAWGAPTEGSDLDLLVIENYLFKNNIL